MKKIHFVLTAMLLSTLLYSCKKNGVQEIDQIIDPSTPQIKYFNFGVNAPSVNFYANSVKVSGITSATGIESTSGVISGSVYPSSNYSLQSAGVYVFKAQLPSTLTTDANLAINTTNATLENSKFYSFYLCGLYNTTAKSADAFIIEDKLPAPDYNVAYVRFINTVPNAAAALNLYVHNTQAPAGTDILLTPAAVAYKGVSDFVAVPIGTYELYARYPSSATVNIISRNGTNTVAFAGGKVYTIGSRGDITITSPTATNRPQLDNTANR
ncbi:DUF4397 domain-containing protein [Mucilaginibacter terrae]|uniref:DUF4397 domain-containing protein n=1 Tax=Mucilaginibacter terrae TaxID=1955052 RepID=UPI00363071AF